MTSSKFFGLILSSLTVATSAAAQDRHFDNIYAFGLTHQDHRDDIGNGEDSRLPIVFKKSTTTLATRRVGTQYQVKAPTRDAAVAAIQSRDPRMASAYRGNTDDLTSLLDYEVEISFSVTAPLDLRNIENSPSFATGLKFYLSNDVSLRNLQILGEGRDDRLDFWGISKSFNEFLVLSERSLDFAAGQSLDQWPAIRYKLEVDGQPRQNTDLSKLLYSPRQMLVGLRERLGVNVLNPGDLVMTGTPGGTAFKVGAFNRFMADLFNLPSTKRLKRFLSGLDREEKALYLRAGSVVTSSSPELGDLNYRVD